MYRFILVFVAVSFVVAIAWVSYIKYGEFQNNQAAASWEQYGEKPELPAAATPPQPAGSGVQGQ
jgi:hypothetical protein